MFDTIIAEADGPIGRITLNRPEKLNPLSTQTVREITRAANFMDDQRDVKVVVVSGRGRAFSTGADMDGMTRRTEIPAHEGADFGREMAETLEGMQAISIAQIQGWCIGGGLVLAAACDLRVAAEDTRFSIPEVDMGFPLIWGGIPRLVREIGPALTKELVLTGRPFDAHEARSAGFLNRVVPASALVESVEQLAKSLSEKARLPLIATKRHVNAVTEQMVGTMRSESDAYGMITALRDKDCQNARRNFLDKLKQKK